MTSTEKYVRRWDCKCNRCGSEWESRTEKKPPICAVCKSPGWDTDNPVGWPKGKKRKTNPLTITHRGDTMAKELKVGDRVAGGTGEDYDTGTVRAIGPCVIPGHPRPIPEGGCWVEWDTLVGTPCDIAALTAIDD